MFAHRNRSEADEEKDQGRKKSDTHEGCRIEVRPAAATCFVSARFVRGQTLVLGCAILKRRHRGVGCNLSQVEGNRVVAFVQAGPDDKEQLALGDASDLKPAVLAFI
jgi:hypothetical protein